MLLKAWLRDWRRHPLQRMLTILGVVIAVAVVLAVDLANQSAQRAFDRSMLEVAGAATHQILGPAEGFDERHYRDLRLAGWRDLAPVVEGALRLESGETVYLLGVDPLAEDPFREAASGFGSIPVQRLMTEPGTVLVPPEWLQRQGIDGESTLRARGAAGLHRLTALPAPAGAAQGQIWVADIATAQMLLDRAGRLDRIDVRLDRGGRAEDLKAQLPPGLELIAVGARDAAARELAQAFRINLTAMSLLALLIAVFLVYNTQTFSVLRRLQVLGSLHLVGVGRGQVVGVVLFEAFLVGLIGTVLGTLFGIWLAQGLVGQVARTVSDHFFTVAVTAVEPRPLALAAVLALGLGLTVLAALAPALEAAGSRGMGASGRAAVERRARNLTGYLFATGLLGLLAGAWIAALGLGGLVGGFVALFLMITGFLLLLPRLLALALRWLGGPVADRFDSPLPRLAGRSLERSLSRSGPAVVALTLALAAAIGVSVLVGSFRVSVADWLGQTLTSDVYLVSAGPAAARSSSRLPGDWADTVRQWPEVASVSTATTLETPSGLGVIDLFLLSPHADWLDHLPLVSGAAPDLDARLRESDAVLITEGFAAHHALDLGDRIEIATPQGRRSFDVAGIYRDYSNPSGTVLMRAERYDPGSAREFASMGLRAAEGVTVEALEARLDAWAREQDRPALVTLPETIEAESLAIFDRTFAITHLLRLITLFVAFVAILSALVALQMERAREYAVLRSTGLLPAGVGQLVFLQGGLLGLYAALAAIPLGLSMGWVLIEVINREAFGWRMDVLLPGMPLVENVALGIGAALLASIYPAWRLARMPLVPALRVQA
ncbi:ABC transporter permease [Thioalkalivibrio paradoxus ARh 1]|uniref:ABC transporter permease n=2 Tax=Thioalkalivibrio paradoxus TaxID=108010 RepID=W0DGM2_9GAMM|nr:ABC transporter permease [Thioalkalivibrio paradoxus ARh 1]